MKAHLIRGGNFDDLYHKNYNLGVPISLGNKWFTVERIVELIKFSLDYTKEHVVVYVADDIHAINIEVRNRKKRNAALRKARAIGQLILTEVKDSISQDNTITNHQNIFYATWSGFKTRDYSKKLEYLDKKYQTDLQFKRAILQIVETFVSNEKKKFTDTEMIRLGDYIIEELPEMLTRVPIDGVLFDANVYPSESDLTKFVEMIQKQEIFPEIKEDIINTQPKVFIEVH